ncbi:MAG: LTA synthase family protein [Oscillospiraceae bacterium]|jgi:lipoteichoic acid synthase
MKKILRERFWLIYMPLSFIYLELFLKLWCFRTMTLRGLVFTVLLAAAAGTLATFVCCLNNARFSSKLFAALLFAATLIFATQTVYYGIFKTFLTAYSVSQAGDVIGNFWRETLQGIWRAMPGLIIVFIPFILWLVFGKKMLPAHPMHDRFRAGLCFTFMGLQVLANTAIMGTSAGVMSAKYLYSESFVPELSVSYFGALTTFRIDLREFLSSETKEADTLIAGVEENMPPEPAELLTPEELAPAPAGFILYEPNVLQIDFDALMENETDEVIQDMHRYFSSVEPTLKNEYTGMFSGKNLVWIVAEGFSSFALSEKHTPTLWKLANSGFVFENFYNPIWGVSTSDGEYVTLTGLIPKVGVWSFSKSSDNYMPFGFGDLLSRCGYKCYAYHNHDYTYYNRHLSHPNMGYVFKGVGNGLVVTDTWPASDLEMVQNTVGEYINEPPFHVYYMTVSGHLYYTFAGNAMSYKHMDEVSDLPYSEGPRAYIACNMEFDLAVEELIKRLDEEGILEDTVIVISGDHYPYALELSEIEELYGGPIDTSFELYHSTLIIWCANMEEPVRITKPCSSLDIMPTLANLFGLSYDSRLVMGRDILSDSEGLVVFYNHSFISETGRYNATTDVFTPIEGLEWSQEERDNYARNMLSRIKDMFQYSAAILDNDYYAKVLSK